MTERSQVRLGEAESDLTKRRNMATKDVIQSAKKELADLTGFKSPSAIGIRKEGAAYLVTIEVVEKQSIPDSMDVLGTYEVEANEKGNILGYKRTSLRKRADTGIEEIGGGE